jgi:hypothetical protein
MKRFAIGMSAAVLLAGCGGTSQTSNDQSMTAQSKQLLRSQKAVAADYATAVQELYVAYFGRPADPTGLTNFENALLAAGAPTNIQGIVNAYSSNPALQSLINSFGTSKESQNLYGSGNATTFVTTVFQNVLGRTPQQQGLSFWVDAISSGTLTQGNAALSIMAGALTNTSAQGLIDAQLVSNRLSIASFFTAQVSSQNAVSFYSGSTAAASARTMLSGVSSTTVISAYEATALAAITALSTVSTTCTPSNLTLANYNAISLGMTLAQVNQTLGCQNTASQTVRTSGIVQYEWDDILSGAGSQLISVDFDATGTVVTGIAGSANFKSSSGLANPTGSPVTAACTPSNFTLANYNAIALGMTLAQVDQVLGCANDASETVRTSGVVQYEWDDILSGTGTQLISVDFDSTGSVVTGIAGSTNFKSSSGF